MFGRGIFAETRALAQIIQPIIANKCAKNPAKGQKSVLLAKKHRSGSFFRLALVFRANVYSKNSALLFDLSIWRELFMF